MNWAKLAQNTKTIQTTNTITPPKPVLSKVLEEKNVTAKATVAPAPEYHFPNRFEQVQEQFGLEIHDAFQSLIEEVRNGPYGYVFSEDRPMRGLDFIHLVNKHMDYGYYKVHGFEYTERINGEDNSSEEEHYWGEKRNKFAYV